MNQCYGCTNTCKSADKPSIISAHFLWKLLTTDRERTRVQNAVFGLQVVCCVSVLTDLAELHQMLLEEFVLSQRRYDCLKLSYARFASGGSVYPH